MKKNETTKAKVTNEIQLLELLKKVLPRATHDAALATRIYDALENELKLKVRAAAFEKFCSRVELPDLEPKTLTKTLMEVKRQLSDSFDEGDVTIKPNKKEQTLAVEVALSSGGQFTNEIKVRPLGPDADAEQDLTPKFVPFPVCLPTDKELVWMLAKRENMTPEEAGIALSKVEEEFWASKAGQKLLRDRVERCFPEFMLRVPAGMLSEAGLKRHYKGPEPLKELRPLPAKWGRPAAASRLRKSGG